MTKIAGKTILLTGASRGIGRCIARQLAQQKATIIGVSRSQKELDQMCWEVKALGGKVITFPFDIGKVEQLPNLVKEIEEQVGSIDILINNAGIEIYKAFPDYSLTEIQSVLSVNLVAAIELTRLVLPQMQEKGSGHIINIASLAAKKGHPYDSLYSASKAGLLMWSDALRQELVDINIKISSICPGYIGDQGLLADTGIPAPRLAGISKAEDVAKAVIKAIEKEQVEVIINGGFLTETLTKMLFAIEQFYPQLGDLVNRLLGVTMLNRRRIKPQSTPKPMSLVN